VELLIWRPRRLARAEHEARTVRAPVDLRRGRRPGAVAAGISPHSPVVFEPPDIAEAMESTGFRSGMHLAVHRPAQIEAVPAAEPRDPTNAQLTGRIQILKRHSLTSQSEVDSLRENR
jgi:hypothetical protein